MTPPAPGTVDSIRQRLLNRARDRGEDFQLTLVRYGVERFLYRLSLSEWADRYIVKGATLFDVWLDRPHRSTRDLDVNRQDAVTRAELESQIRDVCSVEYPEDGLTFDLSGLTVAPIRGPQEGQGLRARFLARLGRTRIPLQIDAGFGDVVTPAPRVEELPTLLDLPAPWVMLYPRETFIAEKFEAMVRLGRTNSRYKDFSDVALLAWHMEFEGRLLREACANTFDHRGTPLTPGDPPAPLRPRFYADGERTKAWRSFARENPAIEHLGTFPRVGELVASFLKPLWEALTRNRPWEAYWKPRGPWNPGRGKGQGTPPAPPSAR